MRRFLNILLVGLAALALNGCGGEGGGGNAGGGAGSGRTQYVNLGTAPTGGAFAPVGNAIASVLNENKGENKWKVGAKGTSGSQENIRMLDKGELSLGMSNSAISYYAAKGENGWDKPYDVRTVVTLAPNVGIFVTKEGSGINSLADLAEKRICVGPGGAGFEMFLGPLMTAHGVEYTAEQENFTAINANYSESVSQLADGNADAAFIGGAIPTPALTQACSTMDVKFIPYDEATKAQLIKDYPYYSPIQVPSDKYTDLEEDFQALNVGSMQLITYANVDEELIYQMTKTIWENREEIAKQHPAAKAINEKNAARFTGTEFHPGAIRFYKEIGIWPEAATAEESTPAETPATGDAAESEASE
jgi:TRAP transporter TAXI family solute receptor